MGMILGLITRNQKSERFRVNYIKKSYILAVLSNQSTF